MTEFDTYSRRPASTGISWRAVMGTSLLAFVGGATLIGWLVLDDKLPFDIGFGRTEVAAPAPKPSPAAAPVARFRGRRDGPADRRAGTAPRTA